VSIFDLYELKPGANEYRSQLRDIYSSFSEGFDTADLAAAKARLSLGTLATLGAQPARLHSAHIFDVSICQAIKVALECAARVRSMRPHYAFGNIDGIPAACSVV
jgi:hypothetical protein